MVKTSFDKNQAGEAFIKGLSHQGKKVPEIKKTPVNHKTEDVASDKLPKTSEPVLETSKTFKSLKILSQKKKHDTIYFHKKKGFIVEKRNNGFVELLKTLFLVNVFKYNLFGYSKNEEKVYKGLDQLTSELETLNDEDKQKLVKTIGKTISVLDEMRLQYKNAGQSFKAGAIENLQNKVSKAISIPSSAITPTKPEFTPPPPPAILPTPPELQSNVQPKAQQKLSEVKLSPASNQVNAEKAKPKLPPIESYEIPEVEVKAALGDYQLAQTRKQKRSDLLQNLNEYYQDFIGARNELIRKNEELEKIAAKLQPKAQTNPPNGQMPPPPPPPSNGAPPPPPPSNGAPPPPPPPSKGGGKKAGATKIQRQPTYRERQLAQLKHFKISPTVELNEQIIELEAKRDLALEQIKETLFPGISGLSFTTDKEIEELEQYVEKYKAKANEEVDHLQEVVERTNPFNRTNSRSSPSRVDESEAIDQQKESEVVVKLRKMLGEITEHQKAIETNKQKVKNYTLDMKQAQKDRSELSDKMTVKRFAASYTASEKQKDVKALEDFKIKAVDRKKGIVSAKKTIDALNEKIDGVKKVLAYEVHIDMNSGLDEVIAKAKEIVAEESNT